MELKAFDKVIISLPFDQNLRGQVIGIKPEPDCSTTYVIVQRRMNFGAFVNGARTWRINSKELKQGIINLKIHTI